MATVLIVSKTQMSNGVCVGGIMENTCELIRLHNERGGNLSQDAPFEIGDRWDLDVQTAWNVRERPHIEDKQITINRKIENIGIKGIINFINTHNFGRRMTRGHLNQTFENCLCLQGTKNFVSRDDIPSFSTQFWVADENLVHVCSYGKHYYRYRNYRLKYVGFQEPIDGIPRGTIIRLSLANWWDGDGSGEDRCYLQLSGWYL